MMLVGFGTGGSPWVLCVVYGMLLGVCAAVKSSQSMACKLGLSIAQLCSGHLSLQYQALFIASCSLCKRGQCVLVKLRISL